VPDLDWPAARSAIDTAIEQARIEIERTVVDALADLGRVGKDAETVILSQVQDSLDDIDQAVPPEEDDG
jgi:F0F1-type ATP synthase membrane subunit b/b'